MKKTIAIALTTFALGGLAGSAFADRQPHMKAALVHLEKALSSLKDATADKGGHRVKAIKAVEEAIAETKAGIDFDDKH